MTLFGLLVRLDLLNAYEKRNKTACGSVQRPSTAYCMVPGKGLFSQWD